MSETTQHLIKSDTGRRSLVDKFASKYSIDTSKLLPILKSTAFRQRGGQEVTNEQMAALLVVADQYSLNPFTKELYAFPQDGGIVPIVGLDGWARIINDRPELNGIDFVDTGDIKVRGKLSKPCPEGVTCIMYRKDRDNPIKVTEWFEECYRDTKPWNEMPRRMLRHKALIQCARLAFALVGIYDEDEGQRIIEGDVIVVNTDGTPYTGGTAGAVNDVLKPKPAEDIADAEIVSEQLHAEEAADVSELVESAPPVVAGGAILAEGSTEHLLQCVMDATTVEELDYVRGQNKEREASKSSKDQIAKAIDNKAKVLQAAAE